MTEGPDYRPRRAFAGARRLLASQGPAVYGVLLVALVVRLAFVLADDWSPIFDSADYDRHARSIADGDGYPESHISGSGDPTALRMPLYPLFLATVYTVTGEGWEAARVAQAFLGTLTVGLIGLLGWRLFERRVGLLAMAVAAVFPPLVFLSGTLMSENLLLPLELGALLAVLQYRHSRSYGWALAAGVCVGLATLTRPNAVILLIPLALGIWTARPRSGLAVAAVLGAALIVYLPWPVRNAVTLESFVPLSTELGLVATGVYNGYAAETFNAKPGQWIEPWRFASESKPIWANKELTEPAMDRQLRAKAFEYVREHPTYPAEVGFWNSLRLLHVNGSPNWAYRLIGLPTWAATVAMLALFPVLLLALAGAIGGAARRVPLFVWLIPVAMWASVMFLANEPRSRAPMDPFILVLAAAGAVALARRLRPSDPAEPAR